MPYFIGLEAKIPCILVLLPGHFGSSIAPPDLR